MNKHNVSTVILGTSAVHLKNFWNNFGNVLRILVADLEDIMEMSSTLFKILGGGGLSHPSLINQKVTLNRVITSILYLSTVCLSVWNKT